jgi:hypothetical protein
MLPQWLPEPFVGSRLTRGLTTTLAEVELAAKTGFEVEGTPQPRRALSPLPDDSNEPEETSPSSPMSPAAGPDDSALTDTGRMRRLAFESDPAPSRALAAPASPSPASTTSVPPPRPVLPVWEPLPASAGRRFSADDAPYESDWAAPRRSAASVTSPMSGYEPLLPPVSRPIAPPQVTVPYQPISRAASAKPEAPLPVPSMAMPTGDAAAASVGKRQVGAESGKRAGRKARAEAKANAKAEARAIAEAKAVAKTTANAEAKAKTDTGRHAAEDAPRHRSRTLAIVIALVVALALIAAAVVWGVFLRNPTITNPAAQAVDPLLGTSEVTAISAGAWQEAGVTKTALCVGQDTKPAAQRTASRLLTSASASILQFVHTFTDDAAATQAFTAQLADAGSCANDTALITGASTVKGLADNAQAIRVTMQGTKDEHHILLLTQSGRTLNTFDVTAEANLTVAAVAQVAATALDRQCSAGGTCPSTVTVTDSFPPAGQPAGWLAAADLPQITPGSGKWTALPTQAVSLSGSQCEDLDLTKVSGTTDSGERVFVLTGDSKAPNQFGLDHAVWTFPAAKAANSLASKLATSISGCTANTPTATVNPGPSVKGSGNGVQITGKTWEITHKLTTGSIMFRVAVVTSGNRVSYLLANPSKDFDFSDAEWAAIALRAGQRASQAG